MVSKLDNSNAIRGALQLTQKRRRQLLAGLFILSFIIILFVRSIWYDDGWIHDSIENIAILLIIVCILGRSWCTLYIGGRKNNELIRSGPYSVCRNPLYFFSFLGVIGVGAAFASLTLALVLFLISYLVFKQVVIKEEQFLAGEFGQPYQDYLEKVPRFIPDMSLWNDNETQEFQPRLLKRTFMDACVFLLIYPVAEFIEYAQDIGILPVLFKIP